MHDDDRVDCDRPFGATVGLGDFTRERPGQVVDLLKAVLSPKTWRVFRSSFGCFL